MRCMHHLNMPAINPRPMKPHAVDKCLHSNVIAKGSMEPNSFASKKGTSLEGFVLPFSNKFTFWSTELSFLLWYTIGNLRLCMPKWKTYNGAIGQPSMRTIHLWVKSIELIQLRMKWVTLGDWWRKQFKGIRQWPLCEQAMYNITFTSSCHEVFPFLWSCVRTLPETQSELIWFPRVFF